MLRIDLRELDRGPVVTRATLPVDDPVVKELDVALARPLEVEGKLQETGPDEYFWQGRLHGLARGQCRRCLAELELPIDAQVGALFSSNPESEDDPSVYPLAPRATHVDLGEAVREELALSVPGYPLCREDCAGLCPRCGMDLNAGPCRCAAPANTQ